MRMVETSSVRRGPAGSFDATVRVWNLATGKWWLSAFVGDPA
jgi:hypothetical protein